MKTGSSVYIFVRGGRFVFLFFPNNRNVGNKNSGQVMSGQVGPGWVRSVRLGQVVSGQVGSGTSEHCVVTDKRSNLWLRHMAYVC